GDHAVIEILFHAREKESSSRGSNRRRLVFLGARSPPDFAGALPSAATKGSTSPGTQGTTQTAAAQWRWRHKNVHGSNWHRWACTQTATGRPQDAGGTIRDRPPQEGQQIPSCAAYL